MHRRKGVDCMVQKHCCENCRRTHLDSQIERYLMQGHVAYLCPTCAYVLVKEGEPERFFTLCGRPIHKQANDEMKKIHALLSQFIFIGLLFITIVAAAAVVQLTNGERAVVFAEQEERLSFSTLNRMTKY